MKFLSLRAFSAVPEFFSFSYPLVAFNSRFLWCSGTSPFALSTAVFRNVRTHLLFPLALFSSHDCKHLEKCPACVLFLSKNSIQCINVTTGMTYNSPRSLDTISLLVNAADSTLYTADLQQWQSKETNTLPLPPYVHRVRLSASSISFFSGQKPARYNLNSSLILQCNCSTFLDIKISWEPYRCSKPH